MTVVAQREIVHLVDDVDGGTADETVAFGLDGRLYEIDLSGKRAAALREHLQRYVAAARRSGATPPGGRTRRGAGSPDRPNSRTEARAMREWARANGYALSDRGRIPAAVVEAYRGGAGSAPGEQAATAPAAAPTASAPEPSGPPDPARATDADVLAWHEAKNYKIPANRAVNGLMRHRYHKAHAVDG